MSSSRASLSSGVVVADRPQNAATMSRAALVREVRRGASSFARRVWCPVGDPKRPWWTDTAPLDRDGRPCAWPVVTGGPDV